MPDLTRPEGKGDKTRRRMASERQFNRYPGLFAVKIVWAWWTAHQSTTSINKRIQWWTQAERSRLKRGPPPMRRLAIHKNIPAGTLIRTLNFRVGFIISHKTADKLFPVNPRAITGPSKISILLKDKSTPAFIIKPRLILFGHTDDIRWYIRPTSMDRCSIKPSAGQQTNVTPMQILYCTTNCIPIDLMLQENNHTNAEVWNSLHEPSKWSPTERSCLRYQWGATI